MKVNDFVAKALEVEKLPTLYQLGKFMNGYKQGTKAKYLLCDCSGLIKGILWGFPNGGKYGSNGVPDINANTIINSYCSGVTSNFSSVSYGELVWLQGHIGIYIGNGNVCECSPKWENGIQITKLNQRKWLKHGKFKFIDYSNTGGSSNASSSDSQTNIDINKVVQDCIDGKYGNGADRKEKIEAMGLNYEEIRALVNKKLKG